MNFIDTISQSLFGGLTGPAPAAPTLFPNSGPPVAPSFGGMSGQPQGIDVASALKTILAPGGQGPQSQPRPQAPAFGGGGGLADALGAILRNSGSVPKPQPPSLPLTTAAVPDAGGERLPWQGAKPAQADAPSSGIPSSGITGKDVASFLRSVMTGAAAVDPSRPGISAFAQGASGSMAARDALTDRETAAKLAAEDRTMSLEDRALKLDDRAFNRAKDVRGEARAGSKEKRDERLNEIRMLEATAKVMRDIDPSLDVKDRIAVERLVRDEGKRMMGAEALSGEELKTRMETYRKELEGRLKSNKPGITGKQPPTAPTAATSKAPMANGDGKSQASPAAPKDKTGFDLLPSGSWFVNPADGRVLQKK